MTIVSPTGPAYRLVQPQGDRRDDSSRGGVNLMAIIAAITGVGLFPFPIVSLLCGGIARSQIRRSGQAGAVLANIGIVLGAIGSVLWIGLWLAVLAYKGLDITLPFTF